MILRLIGRLNSLIVVYDVLRSLWLNSVAQFGAPNNKILSHYGTDLVFS
jgi:hypothetical protein